MVPKTTRSYLSLRTVVVIKPKINIIPGSQVILVCMGNIKKRRVDILKRRILKKGFYCRQF